METHPLRCLHCHHSNPHVSAYCQKCAEPLNGHVSRGSVRKPLASSRVVLKYRTRLKALAYDWNPTSIWLSPGQRLFRSLVLFLVVMGSGALMYRIMNSLKGTPEPENILQYHFYEYSSYRYLVNFQNTFTSWASRHNQLDTQLASRGSEETGSLTLSTLSSHAQRHSLLIEPLEWIATLKTGTGQTSTPVDTEDPSLKSATVLLDKEGHVLSRSGIDSVRLGRSLPFLMPRWPDHPIRKGDRWIETVEWTDDLDDWKIHWLGTLHWTLLRLEPCAGSTCARLSCDGELTPSVKESPPWAHDEIASIQFNGDANGVALFDMKLHQLASNTFTYHGALSIALSRLDRLPAYRTIPGPRVHEPGAIVVQLKSTINISKP